MNTGNQTASDTKEMGAIERALLAAKARKAAKQAAAGDDSATLTLDEGQKPIKAKLTDEQKAEIKAKKEEDKALKAEDRAKRKAERDAARAAKKAEKGDKPSSHMKKVEAARSKCPDLTESARNAYDQVTARADLSIDDLNALAQHVAVEARARATQRAMSTPQIPLGATVRIIGGDHRFRDKVGEVVHSQRLRAKVKVKGISEPVYLYTGEAEIVEATE